MRTRPSWLMSMVFPRRMGEIPAIPDKGTGAVLTRNNQAIRGPTATRLNYFAARCPAGVALVRFDCVSRVRDRDRRDEHVLRELRHPPRLRRPRGSRRPSGRSSTRRPASVYALSDALPVLCALPTEGDVLGYALRPLRRLDEELLALLRRLSGPGRRDRRTRGGRLVRHLRDGLARLGFLRGPLDDPADGGLRAPRPLVDRHLRHLRDPHEHRHGRHDRIRRPPVPRRADDRGTGLPTGTPAIPQHPWGQPPARAPHLRTHHPSIRLDHIRLRRGSERGGERRRSPLWWAHPVGRARRPGALPLHPARPLSPRDHDGERERGRRALAELA